MARSKEETLDPELQFEELMTAYHNIMEESCTYYQWHIPMTPCERIHFGKHPPTEEQIEELVRLRGALKVSGRGILEMRLPDKLVEMFRRMPEFQELQQIG